jgi:hypothetical protein
VNTIFHLIFQTGETYSWRSLQVYLGKLHISQLTSSGELRYVQCGQVQSGPGSAWLVTAWSVPLTSPFSLLSIKPTPLPAATISANATLCGRDCGGDEKLAAINCSTVAQCSDCDQSCACWEFWVLTASRMGPIYSCKTKKKINLVCVCV